MNVRRARQVMSAIARHARHIAICPGSRSTPLALAADAHPDLQTHVILDERSAGFWALGVSKTGTVGVVITTSGTAVANLLPAAVEAHQTATPWIALTADRPPHLRHTGANQTIDQRDLFGVFAPTIGPGPEMDDELTQALSAGPVHLNVPFDEPLVADAGAYDGQSSVELSRPRAPLAADARLVGKGLIVAGPEAHGEWAAIAHERGIPLLADPLSGQTGIRSYDAILTDPPALAPDWILQVGRTPISKSLGVWLRRHDAVRFRIDPDGRRWDEGAPTWLDGDPTPILQGASLTPWTDWQDADARASPVLAEAEGTPTEAGVALEVLAASDGRRIFAGNSLIIRELDRFAQHGPQIAGNRGASGIDGNIATAAGMAEAGPVTAVIGDLTCQHDVGSLALVAERELKVVVIDNGGGGIFRHLPIADDPTFDRLFLTPQHFDPVQAARAFGLQAARADPGRIAEALATNDLVHVVVDGEASAAWRQAITARAAAAAKQA